MTTTWKHEVIAGSDLSGSDGAANRTYVLSNQRAITPGMLVVVDGAVFQLASKFSFSSNTITFLAKVWDSEVITLDYQTQDLTVSGSTIGYTSALQVARVTGIGVEVKNENVGTGDSSNVNFDLDNGNVVAGSYILKYSASTSDNDFTSLDEGTHYTIDKDGGTIVLTATGVTVLATNILWADYIHSPKMSNTYIESYLPAAEEEVDAKTGNYWGSYKSETEFFDARKSFTYPTTDEPYVRYNDYDEPDKLQLKYKGVNSLQGVYFLNQGVGLGQVERYSSVAGTYTDVTAEANSPGGTAFQPFATVTAANDYLYVGASNQFHSLNTVLFTVGVTSGTNTAEYWDGSSWTSFSVTESESGVLNFEADGKLTWSPLASWSKTSVDSGTSKYFIRIKANAVYTTEAKLNALYVGQDFMVDRNIPLQTISWNVDGRLSFTNSRLPNGNQIVRVDYKHGYSSVPDEVAELASLFAGLRVYANITGGSYDDATGYTLGRESISIGEVYVNVREVVRQFEERIKSILGDVGTKMDISVI
jgi:hypothetical protein